MSSQCAKQEIFISWTMLSCKSGVFAAFSGYSFGHLKHWKAEIVARKVNKKPQKQQGLKF